jgi:hypothetical protein
MKGRVKRSVGLNRATGSWSNASTVMPSSTDDELPVRLKCHVVYDREILARGNKTGIE